MPNATPVVRAATLLLTCAAAQLACAAELIQLNEKNFSSLCPRGKEPDAIYGDWVLRNEHMVAVIAAPLPTRNANMTVRNVGGMLIDLTARGSNSDQLSCFYPGGARYNFHDPQAATVTADGTASPLLSATRFEARKLSVSFEGELTKGSGSSARVTYWLGDGDESLGYKVELTNASDQPEALAMQDLLRCDGATFKFGNEDATRMFWAEDSAFGQAYGWLPDEGTIERGKDGRTLAYRPSQSIADVAPGQSRSWSGRVLCSQGLPGLRSAAAAVQGGLPLQQYQLKLSDADGPVADCEVEFLFAGQSLGAVQTDDEGWIRMRLGQGDYQLQIRPYAREPRAHQMALGPGALAESLTLNAASRVIARVTDQDGRAIPAKLQFIGLEPTTTPNFGPDSSDFGVRNLLYTADGKVSHPLAPGNYRVIASHGPEYDAFTQTIEVSAGQVVRIQASLSRSVDTSGWISGEFHSHSSPSGDNVSSQLGRVLNLLAENLEFAPCTEHNRIDSYEEHLRALKADHLMATCIGMELTGSPLPVNHQNAFPLKRTPHVQDGGAPLTDVDPVVQIKRLAMWDDGSDKVVQMNHPHLPQILGDRDLDGTADEGFREMFDWMDVVEIHPLETIFSIPAKDLAPRDKGSNRMFNWMQMLNLGYATPGVVNTDAHYNWHGSGWLRNYIACATDDPAKVTTEQLLKAIQAGQMIMTTAPFLQVELRSSERGQVVKNISGSTVKSVRRPHRLWVRVQCANWYDINRVQVFANGRAVPELNFTRASHGSLFGGGNVRFEAEVELPSFASDTHLIVATIGEGLTLGEVMGSEFGKTPPVAVSNPIYLDVDGDTFRPSGDDLGVPFMLPAGTSVPLKRSESK